MGEDKVTLWVHGHFHDSFDYDVYGTRVVCNPRGYSPDALNPGFDSDLVIEVEKMEKSTLVGWIFVGAAALCVYAVVQYSNAPADPPGTIENPRLASMFNEVIEKNIARMNPEKSPGYTPQAQSSAREFLGSLKSVVQYRKLKHKQHPNLPNGMDLHIEFVNGSSYESEFASNKGSVANTGVRLAFDHGLVVSAQTDGTELEKTLESTKEFADRTIADIIMVDMNRNHVGYFQAPSAPTEADNRKAWRD